MGRERGSVTVLVLGVVVGGLSLLAGVLAVGAATVARHQAESVADLAALSALSAQGAQGAGVGTPAPAAPAWSAGVGLPPVAPDCAAAAEVARAAGARLERCVVDGSQVEVRVAVPVGPGTRYGSGLTAVARARAGPGPSVPAP